MTASRASWALLALVALTGCMVGPNYVRPVATEPMPESFSGGRDLWKTAAPRDALARGDWWSIFGDAELDRLEALALEGNQRLHAAAARLEQARASADVARSGLFPRIGAGAAASRQHDSEDRPLATTGVAAGKAFTYDNFSVPFDLSWELDLFGRQRRQLEGARARAGSEVAELAAVRLAVTAEVAADYFAARSLDDERTLLVRGVESFRRALDLVQARRKAGLATDLDLAQAETALRSAEALLPPNALTRARFEHALAVLTGQPAPLFHLAEGRNDHEAPLVPPGLPSDLLERRPDVAAAERRMAAANAGIGFAEAAYYPSLRLGATAGTQSIDVSSLFSASSFLWAFGAAASLPVFQGGQQQAAVRAARGAWDEAVARYRDTVLTAFAEVEDNLVAQQLLGEEYERLAAAAAAARLQETLAVQRYEHGLISYLPVVTAQSLAFERDRAVIRSRAQRAAAAVALIKALGGGWTDTSLRDDSAPTATAPALLRRGPGRPRGMGRGRGTLPRDRPDGICRGGGQPRGAAAPRRGRRGSRPAAMRSGRRPRFDRRDPSRVRRSATYIACHRFAAKRACVSLSRPRHMCQRARGACSRTPLSFVGNPATRLHPGLWPRGPLLSSGAGFTLERID
ncbi:efflux transporter outer membrane subunit [Anaeromyxobacter sp. PSR-1]|uniref:efflux transporter outer membrane subunit n=1 Tax=Anaeromyxobacter sp. PSR-1 TaxID=1300915 RepID=UPI0005E2754C|nr:efflux transporter outer membrane subunit [Anaeromyxobacter sp. PSR-1]GAO01478.1 outer membrane protein OprM [Anaeromyxobacter sp. PSR-1]